MSRRYTPDTYHERLQEAWFKNLPDEAEKNPSVLQRMEVIGTPKGVGTAHPCPDNKKPPE